MAISDGSLLNLYLLFRANRALFASLLRSFKAGWKEVDPLNVIPKNVNSFTFLMVLSPNLNCWLCYLLIFINCIHFVLSMITSNFHSIQYLYSSSKHFWRPCR